MAIVASFTMTPALVKQSHRACRRVGYVVVWCIALGFVGVGIADQNAFPILIGVAYPAIVGWLLRRGMKSFLPDRAR